MITSTSNPQIKLARKLQRDRKERQQSGLFYIEGLRIAGEAVELGWEIDSWIAAPELLVSEFGQDLIEAQRRQGKPVLEVSGQVFKSMALKEGPQGIAALARQRWLPLEQVRLEGGSTWVALDAVADPGNLGTILRTLDGVGGAGIILLDQSTDPYDPSTVRASMGAIFSQKLVKVPFPAFAAWKRATGAVLIGTSDRGAVDYQETAYPQDVVLLMGSERHGLLEQHVAICDTIVRIPMVGRSDSLNLAVATAVILYEIFNQHRRVR